METSPKRKNKHSVKPSHNKTKPAKTNSHFWKVYAFFRSNLIVTTLILVLLLAFVLKYYEDVHDSYSNFKKMDENIYEILEVSRDAKDSEIKAKYRELSLKWHPDKNKDCVECEKRFLKIKEAYKIILNPYLRELYDKTSGYTVDVIPSKTVNLTLSNYPELVGPDVWVVQIYSDDNARCKAFSALWDEFATKYQKFAKFGRINVFLEQKLLKKLNVNPKIHPALLMLHNNKYDLFPNDVLNNLNVLSGYFVKNYPFTCNHVKSYKEFKAVNKKNKLLLYNKRVGINSDVPLNLKYLCMRFNKVLPMYYTSSDVKEEVAQEVVNTDAKQKLTDSKNTLFVGFYDNNELKYMVNNSTSNLTKLEKLFYTLFTLNVFEMDSDLNVLCSRYNIKERLCVFTTSEDLDLHEMYKNYEMYNEVEKNAEPVVAEENEKVEVEEVETDGTVKPKKTEEPNQLLSNRDLQFVKVDHKHKSELGTGKNSVMLVNLHKNSYFLLGDFDEALASKLLNDEVDITWTKLPSKLHALFFSKSKFYDFLNALKAKLM
ncbi:uncharacterized protein TA14295 [Theileria annulata]|uniref:J domain-containing protein n=1 Tax=Theileria annulata TaxID=5874 RepID=Q4UEZ3_THEAN|nr:uncharacterized protein TA14295 [Theileria annulata]CAI74346.1 hypothetical protein, conserved [Theileria annulata]|eukprot:XP_952078.1 hypothetical protein, conserved [Theileria annulata]